jgi:hypothetical protein
MKSANPMSAETMARRRERRFIGGVIVYSIAHCSLFICHLSLTEPYPTPNNAMTNGQ